jgi:hypothetical protein
MMQVCSPFCFAQAAPTRRLYSSYPDSRQLQHQCHCTRLQEAHCQRRSLQAHNNITVDGVNLELGNISETVEVEAEAPLLQTDAPFPGNIIPASRINHYGGSIGGPVYIPKIL